MPTFLDYIKVDENLRFFSTNEEDEGIYYFQTILTIKDEARDTVFIKEWILNVTFNKGPPIF